MFPYQNVLFSVISFLFILATITAQYYANVRSNNLYPQSVSIPNLKPTTADRYLQDKLRILQALEVQDKVRIDLYYECLCPDCRVFDTGHLTPTVKKLGKYLDIHLYPYGNAKTIVHQNGTYQIICQHGPSECYGNMLHACAIDKLSSIDQAIYYNSCMMDSSQNNKGSDDEAADKCGAEMNIDSESIKACAKSPRGLALLKYYGDESHKVGFKFVPYILINGVQNNGDNFLRDVCAAFKRPPQECNEIM